MTQKRRRLDVLLAAVLLNYIAQIPYYLHQYYFPRHLVPSLPGTAALVVTFAWFLVGYLGYITGKKYGLPVLLTFLATQVLFYGHAIILGILLGGGIVAQLQTHSPLLFVVFVIGYLNFAVAGYYLYWLIRHRKAFL